MSSVRHVKHPQQSHLEICGRGATGVPIHAATAKLWLTLRIEIDACAVVLEYLNDGEHFGQRILERFGGYEVEVVVRRVILRESSIRRTRETSHREVEAGRTVLSLVVTVRHEVEQRVRARQAKNVSRRTVYQSGSPTTAFISGGSAVSQTGQHQAVTNPTCLRLVSGEPGYGPDRARDEEKAESVLELLVGKMAGEKRSHGHAGEIVVRERWMAAVDTDQNFVSRCSRQDAFPVRQMARSKGGIDADLVLAIGHLLQRSVRQAEAPLFGVVRGTIWNDIRLLRQ